MKKPFLLHEFAQDTRGNFAIITAIALMAMVPAVGLAVDDSNASRVRAEMSQALDAALLGAARDRTTDKALLQTRLTELYKANLGVGDALVTEVRDVDGLISVQGSASAKQKTTFANFFGRDEVSIAVRAEVSMRLGSETPGSAIFELGGISGEWDKTATLVGRRTTSGPWEPVLSIDYDFLSSGRANTTVSRYIGSTAQPELKRECTSTSGDMKGHLTCTYQRTTPDGQTESVDVADSKVTADLTDFVEIALKYEITSSDSLINATLRNYGTPKDSFNKTAATNEMTIAGRMFSSMNDPDVDRSKWAPPQRQSRPLTGAALIECGMVGHHKWEDGANGTQGTVGDTDFEYFVTGADCRSAATGGDQAIRLTR